MVACQKSWMERPEFVAAVREEYLNERSHYRETGIKQTRYKRVCMVFSFSTLALYYEICHQGKFIERDTVTDPPLDSNGKYRWVNVDLSMFYSSDFIL